MKYSGFTIEKYRAIKKPIHIPLSNYSLLPLIGVNECGKTTILQAIFAFDFYNDDEYEGRHLENTTNLYDTKEQVPEITATLEINHKEIRDIWTSWREETTRIELSNVEETESEDEEPEDDDDAGVNPFEDLPENIIPSKNEFSGSITITRNLSTSEYSIISETELPTKYHDSFAREFVRRAPFILYNDDFQDRPPSRIDIPRNRNSTLKNWASIYEQLFKETDKEYSLFDLSSIEDARRIDSIVSDVQAKLNKTLSSAWKTFQLDSSRKIQIKLNYKAASAETLAALEVNVVEKIGEKERHFHVTNRSKGFLWFYNFVMKLEFNPKVTGNKANTIHLLDEPGCYLHANAQEKLCVKLSELSKGNGVVIYCTHSHKLLDPDKIPLNSIHIVSKSTNKIISLTPLPEFKTTGQKINAIQPVLEALQLSLHDFIDRDKPVIAVEGIYDKYAISLFMPDSDQYWIYPGTSAPSIIKTIQLLNAFSVNYMALWDNDPEGRKSYGEARKFFGDWETEKFDFLQTRAEGKDRKMEQMFEATDLEKIKIGLKLPDNAHYESIVGGLFHAKTKLQKSIKDELSENTKNNFRVLKKIIDKRLK